jgi:hypothetical protein
MGKDKEEPSEEPTLTLEDKNKLLLIESIIRMNAMYETEALEKSSIPSLEALYEAEKLRENADKKKNTEPKPSFMKAPIKHTPDITKTEKKKNKAPDDKPVFNALEVFKSQYIDPTRLQNCRVDDTAEILTMRVNANPKFPEWQVS